MRLRRLVFSLLLVFLFVSTVVAQTAAELSSSLEQLTLDPQETYHVRDIRLRKGDVSIYLNEGMVSFASVLNGRVIAAVFSTQGVDAGDAELLLLPPQPAERASLATFTKSPNLDEHFNYAVFLFADDTRQEILKQNGSAEEHRDTSVSAAIAAQMTDALRASATRIRTRIVQSILREPDAANGFFFSVVVGRHLGPFNLLYDPEAFEPVLVGSAAGAPDNRMKLWTSYRPRSLPSYQPPPPSISNYKIDATIAANLSLHTTAAFDWKAGARDGRAIALALSRRLNIDMAQVDGEAAEVVQEYAPDFAGTDSDSDVLVVPKTPVVAGRTYRLTLHYSGFIVRRVTESSYFVSERNVWYPHVTPMLTTFDMTFHCPARFQVVSTGEPVTDSVAGDTRTVHRITGSAQQLAGFNLGEYQARAVDSGNYRIECYADKSVDADMNNIPRQCQNVVQSYTERWLQLPIHTLAVTPITGYFGQGFPGLIYLSTTAYQAEQNRPSEVRNARADTFFEDVLLPHEIAHQWWGNLVSSASYRTDWLMESMANYSALQLLETNKGREALNAILSDYKRDLVSENNGMSIESAGPVDFGTRLMSAQNERTWQVIVYEKGTWILHMLRERLGEERFHALQLDVLRRYAGKPITNEQFREAAAGFVPQGQPDPHLTSFFETWVYGTGLPAMHLNHNQVEMSGVDDEFTTDVPLTCKSHNGEQLRWIRAVSGSNPLPSGAASCRLPKPNEFLYTE